MPIDKITISHIVSELIIITGVVFYYHRKCNHLQQQINELNLKLEKLNGTNYINSINRHDQFEKQTVQHINKLYSIINLIKTQNVDNVDKQVNLNFQTNSNDMFVPLYKEKENIRENYYEQNSIQGGTTRTLDAPISNPFMNTLSMLGPLTTMFKVVMEPKPPRPDEIFNNIDIKSELSKNKIVEIESDERSEVSGDLVISRNQEKQSETNSFLNKNSTIDMNKSIEDDSILDNELKEELDDLCSTTTSSMTTPRLTPSHNLNLELEFQNKLEECENGMCKISLEKNIKGHINENVKITNTNIEFNDQSNPLRYISQIPDTKRGRPKQKNKKITLF